jgi:hypothetical protein
LYGATPDSELSRDYAALFSDMPLSDVELEIEGKVLKAHKAILWGNCAEFIKLISFIMFFFYSGRSTVFRAMFSHDMTETVEWLSMISSSKRCKNF